MTLIVDSAPSARKPMPPRSAREATPSCSGHSRWIVALGPRWVRAATVEHGHQQSPAVTNGSDEPQVIAPPAQAAGVIHADDSNGGPEGRGCWIAVTPRARPGGLTRKHLRVGRRRAQ
jgi:hypothetical protein